LGLDVRALDGVAAELADPGLAGIEAYYGRDPRHERAALVALARRNGLVPTGGSDYHGVVKPDLAVGTGGGDLSVPDEVLAELRDRSLNGN
ncbi:MAG: PHP domain-containing protein, partial [Acidimicrobiales bacterium]